MGLFSRFWFVVAHRRQFACRIGAPARRRRLRFRAGRRDDGPGLNSARGGGAMLDAAARDQS